MRGATEQQLADRACVELYQYIKSKLTQGSANKLAQEALAEQDAELRLVMLCSVVYDGIKFGNWYGTSYKVDDLINRRVIE